MTPLPFPVRRYQPLHTTWPYSERDFQRADESDDQYFYVQPRFVAHIDDAAISRLTAYYSTVLPKTGRILDLCTSWQSWYPRECERSVNEDKTLEIFGMGLNGAELARNPLLRDFPERALISNLNEGSRDIKTRWSVGRDIQESLALDCVTCTVSIDYLIRPLEILRSVRESMSNGGKIHLAISNRCFHTKVIRIWMDLTEQERLQLVGDYLHFSGWQDVEIVDLCAMDSSGKRITDDQGFVRSGAEAGSQSHLDPLWIVRGTAKH